MLDEQMSPAAAMTTLSEAAETTAVCADVAVAEPAELEAVTATAILEPTSAAVNPYVCAVAAVTSLQLAPLVSQRRHWYAYVIGCVPDQVPGLAARV